MTAIPVGVDTPIAFVRCQNGFGASLVRFDVARRVRIHELMMPVGYDSSYVQSQIEWQTRSSAAPDELATDKVDQQRRSGGLDILERVAQDSRYLEQTVQDGAEVRNINGAAMPGINRQITAEYDKHILTRQPDFDARKTRADFRKVIPNLRTVVIHCFDPRVTSGIPYAVAETLPGQEYPGEVFGFVDDYGNESFGSSTTIFPIVNAGGRASGSSQRSISVACHLFDIDNVAVVHHTDCGGTHFTPEGFYDTFKDEFGQDISALWDDDDIALESFETSLHRDVRNIRYSPGTPRHVNVYGYLYDIATGALHLVDESPGDPTAPRGQAWR
jgi:carbonic anhydrase